MLEKYTEFVKACSSPGSNLSGSYARALRYVSEMLRTCVPKYARNPPIWEIRSLNLIDELYWFVKEEERKGDESIFTGSRFPKSYLKQRFCTNALKTFGRFLSLSLREEAALSAFETENDAHSVASTVEKLPILKPHLYLEDCESVRSRKGKETIRQVKQRQNQWIFRRMIIRNYGSVCCLTGLPVVEALRASHIVGWAEDEETRLLPSNGLCLAATYDAVFDRHLISFDDDFRMVLSPTLKEFCTNDVFNSVFKRYEGKRMTCDVRFPPDRKLMERHRNQLLK